MLWKYEGKYHGEYHGNIRESLGDALRLEKLVEGWQHTALSLADAPLVSDQQDFCRLLVSDQPQGSSRRIP